MTGQTTRTQGGSHEKARLVVLHLLDGVVEAPQTWHFPYFNDETGAVIGEAIGASDALLMGRRTYEEWAAFWPHLRTRPRTRWRRP